MCCRLLFIMLLFLHFCGQTKSQEQNAGRDSIKTVRDSLRTIRDSLKTRQDTLKTRRDSVMAIKDSLNYRAIEKFSQKSKFTRFLHNLIFKSINPEANRQTNKVKIKKPKTYRKSEGKIIRDIHIITLDPFGYHIQDTSIHPGGFLMKAGNSLHLKTQPKVIKNLLLFKKNEPYDSLLVNESARLIRSQDYVRDVLVYSLPTSKKADSVDVYIRVLDVWSIVPALMLSKSTVDVALTDNNFAGLGNSFHVDMRGNRPTGDYITRISYLIPNIRNSHISFNLQYRFSSSNDLINSIESARSFYSPISSDQQYLFSGNKDLIKSIEFSRSFYSPVAKWAGGIFLGQMITAQSYIKQDTILYLSSRTNIQDYWAARSWQMFIGNSADGRITNLILSGRFLRTRFPERPPEAELANVFNKENIYFAGIGITSRKYIRDNHIFNFGRIEDVPAGRAFGITIGFDVQQTNRWYWGLLAAWGNYFRFGYLSAQLEYGTFVGSAGFQQEVVTGRINYYTRLLNLGNWKIRQFIKPTLIFGINRLATDNLTFSEGMKGFSGFEYPATCMMVLTLQTQSYAPWDLIGFHFGPFLFSSFGMLGNESSGFSDSRLYTLLGLGILIKNDYLMFNTFQLSMTFYPIIPGRGYNIFNANAFKTSDYGFMDFEISKPGVVDYR